MKTKREQELESLKKSINEESVAHESAMSNLRQKHSNLVEELNGQLETNKKVKKTAIHVIQAIHIGNRCSQMSCRGSCWLGLMYNLEVEMKTMPC